MNDGFEFIDNVMKEEDFESIDRRTDTDFDFIDRRVSGDFGFLEPKGEGEESTDE